MILSGYRVEFMKLNFYHIFQCLMPAVLIGVMTHISIEYGIAGIAFMIVWIGLYLKVRLESWKQLKKKSR